MSDIDLRMVEEDFEFLLSKRFIVHPKLHRYIMREAEGEFMTKSFDNKYCAKLFKKTYREIYKAFPNEFEKGKPLYCFDPAALYYYFRYFYSWHLPSSNTINSIIKNVNTGQAILEVGSGPGLYSKIFSHHFPVFPTDIKLDCTHPDIDFWMQPIIYPCEQSIKQNPQVFILSVYPYPDMIKTILEDAAIGQKICIIIPPLAGISRECIVHILDNFRLLDKIYGYANQSFDNNDPVSPPYWAGVVVEKTCKWEFNYDYSGNTDYHDWQTAVDNITIHQEYEKQRSLEDVEADADELMVVNE